MIRFDKFLINIRDGPILTNNEFELLLYDKEGNVISVWYNGVYVIVDNGYLAWSCTVPPFSVTNKIGKTRWSRWVESMRKDVECTFGILKGRWRILKSGVCVYGMDKVDDIWLTCCALHNWLLDFDGLSGHWNDMTIVRFDTFLTDVRAGRILTDNEFELLSYDKEGNVISVWYNGVYVIVDNGYLAWSCTVPPIFVTKKIDETRWSRWVESMRKDVECTFGILKGRWRIL